MEGGDEGKYQVDNTGPVQGQVIGDHLQITQHFYGSGSAPSSGQQAPSPVLTDPNRQHMLKRVRSIWITGVLEQSLHGAALIALGLQGKPDALANPWRLLVQEVDQPAQALPSGTRITEVYDKTEGALLILGEPGSGKTTLLLELTRDLLDRAEANPDDGIPIIFNLSSWAKERLPLADWLVEELSIRYDVPRRLGQSWVSNDRLLLLLDGLDEVSPAARNECIQEINRYREAHLLVPVVVCSRSTEYFTQHTQLWLHTAVVIQPLTPVQIDEYLVSAGAQAEALHVAIHTDLDLQELATTPLMLSVLTLAYQGTPLDEITALDSLKTRQRQVFDAYVQRMLKRRSAGASYTPQQTTQWLSWLARRMKQQSQAIFYLEWMQPDWLLDVQLRFIHRAVGRFGYGLSYGPAFGLVLALILRLVPNLDFGPVVGLPLLLVSGLSLGLILGVCVEMVFGQNREIKPTEVIVWSWQGVRSGLPAGLAGTLVIGLLYGVLYGLVLGLVYGLTFALALGLIFGVSVQRMDQHDLATPNQGIWRSVQYSVYLGLAFGLIVGLAVGLLNGFPAGVSFGLIVGLVVGLVFGGEAFIQHFVLRWLLWYAGYTPLNFSRFLDYAAERILLRKVGGGYIFIHRLLLDYFASLAPTTPTSAEKHCRVS